MQDLVYTTASAVAYAKVIVESAARRSLQKSLGDSLSDCNTGARSVLELSSQIRATLDSIDTATQESTIRPIYQFREELIARFDAYHEGKLGDYIIPTPFTQLNSMIGGGLYQQQFSIIAARTSMGKTTIAHNIACAAAANGVPVAIFSLEMTGAEVLERMACALAHLDSNMLRNRRLSDNQLVALKEAVGLVCNMSIHIDDSSYLTDSQFRARTKTLATKHGVRLVVVDYLQCLAAANKAENRQQEVSAVSTAMRIAARESNVAVLALSQLSREPEKRAKGRPNLSDLRESGALEQDAHNVMFLYWEHKYNAAAHPGISELIVEKQRNGPTGAMKLTWLRDQTRFVNYAEE
jgi:replicative DNA helicase